MSILASMHCVFFFSMWNYYRLAHKGMVLLYLPCMYQLEDSLTSNLVYVILKMTTFLELFLNDWLFKVVSGWITSVEVRVVSLDNFYSIIACGSS